MPMADAARGPRTKSRSPARTHCADVRRERVRRPRASQDSLVRSSASCCELAALLRAPAAGAFSGMVAFEGAAPQKGAKQR